MQENKLQVTSAFQITPTLGFRIFALCRDVQAPLFDDVAGIKPFLSHLHPVSLDPLRGREDFLDILETLFPSVYKMEWMPDLLFRCIQHIEERFHKMRGQLLDNIQFTIKHVLKLFTRVDRSLQGQLHDTSDAESLFLPSAATQGLVQDIGEVYLAHLYSQAIFGSVMGSLLTSVINPYFQAQSQAPVDLQEFSDYSLMHGR